MCSNPATSKEHVPPRCLFPEQKDLPAGVDLRKQLITVPSCEVHNSEKSHDDEFLLSVLPINLPNNEMAKDHVCTKVQRAIDRNPSSFRKITEKKLFVEVGGKDIVGKQPTLAVQIDESRLNNILERIGRALYFKHFGEQWAGEVFPYPHFLLHITPSNAAELNERDKEKQKAVELMMQGKETYGENPEVFCYQLAEGSSSVALVMYLRFYEGSRVTLLFKRLGS